MTGQSLDKFPDSVLEVITGLLPQQSKINLALTNYRFYRLVQPLLYETLLFTLSSALQAESEFRSSLATIVGGSNNPLVSKRTSRRIFDLRQEVLLQSLTINEELCTYVKKVVIYTAKGERISVGDEDTENNEEKEDGIEEGVEQIELEDASAANLELIEFIKKHCVNLEQFTVIGDELNGVTGLNGADIDRLKKLKRLDIDDLSYLDYLNRDSIKTLVINKLVSHDFKIKREKEVIIEALSRLDTLMINDDAAQVLFLQYLLEGWEPERKLKLETIKFIHYHGFNDYNIISRKQILQLLRVLDNKSLKNLEMTIGCDHMACNCLEELMDETILKKDFRLEKLAIQQHTVHRDHNYSEKFDFYVSDLLTKLKSRDSIRYLSISYDTPRDFNIGNGIAGNFYKRKKLFLETLPKLKHLETLVLPHFLENVACYEQMMSDLLWNGCKCSYCKKYLPLFDYYVMHHQYYDGLQGYLTDLISPVLFGSAGRVLSGRLINDSNLFTLQYPPLDKYWDFHEGNGITHFKEEEAEECEFNESCFKPLAKCISHFFLTYIHLYGVAVPGLKLVVMNGEYFERMKGLASEWVCVYDLGV
ncbi:DEKNAAC103801 [Brettanomyces naardenensis]|uniref:DEKNAAC103801 n=1 Tax=Brettanomyces naardenensis TaxID=13370 RepID=A0A448YP73_BRENA|nr:DEKNAAC103801 [Brettanomyces naardenensis]